MNEEIKETELNLEDEGMNKWLEEEAETLNLNQPPKFEQLPALKFVENKITEIDINFGKPFQKYTTNNQNGVTVIKAIIPSRVGAENKIWWLNVKNPIYREVVDRGLKGQRKFKILQIGNQNKTQYKIVE